MLSIIIVTYNSSNVIDSCLKSIFNSKNKIKTEVIVIDNNSSDSTVDIIKREYPSVQLFENEKNLGFSKANNLGIKNSSGELTLILNPDVVITDQSLDNLVNVYINSEKIGILSPILKYPNGDKQYSYRRFPTINILLSRLPILKLFYKKFENYYLYKDLVISKFQEVDWVIGAAILIESKLLKKLKGLDERYFMYFEDTDLCYRVKKLNKKVVVTNKVVFYHSYKQESKSKINITKYYHISSMIKYIIKWRLV